MLQVLLVDDDEQHLQSLSDGLRSIPNVAVAACKDATSALQVVEMAPPDMIITALDLDRGSPLELIQLLQHKGEDIPDIVFMTDPLSGDLTTEIHRSTDSDVLLKPVNLADLRKIVQGTIERQQETGLRPLDPSLSNALDIVRIAMLSGGCVRVRLNFQAENVGQIVVRDGGVWAAEDGFGVGEWAFCRLLQRPAVATCEPISADECGESNVGSTDLLDTGPIGLFDTTPPEAPSADSAGEPTTPSVPPDAVPPATVGGADPTAPANDAPANDADKKDRTRRFNRALDRGIDALLCKDYAEALDALRLADSIQAGHPIVTANLDRLQELGYS